ncbi:MAG: sensor histidine kinase, partial [Planctomycetia bacterium]
LTQNLFAVDLGIDQLLVRDAPADSSVFPGRMAPFTALEMFFLGGGLLFLNIRRGGRTSQFLALAALLLGLVTLLGYFFGAPELHTFGPFGSVAVHSAATIIVLAIGLLAAQPKVGVVALLWGRGVGGKVLRGLLPAALLVPIVIGWLRFVGQRDGWYDWEFGLALYCVLNVVVFSGFVCWSALTIQQFDQQRLRADASLRESQDLYRLVTEAAPHLVWTMRPDESFEFVNTRWMDYTGMTLQALNEAGWRSTVHPDDLPAMVVTTGGPLERGEAYEVEFRLRSRENDYRWFLARAVPLKDAAGRVVKWLGSGNDVETQKTAEARLKELNAALELGVAERTAQLRESEERFHAFMDHAPIGAWMVDERMAGVFASRGFDRLTGLEPGALIGRTSADLFPPAIADKQVANTRRVLETGRPVADEEQFLRADGSPGVAFVVKFPVPGPDGRSFVGGVALDVTDRAKAEERTQASLREKEVLLKEIHPRVKNNLQIVSTLLDLQSGHTTDSEVLEMFKESRGRVKSMALIHERLYRSQDLAGVDFAEYIRLLANDLYRTYRVSCDEIQLRVDVDVPPLSIDVAIPCGLLLNELMSNCFKHAFADAECGLVEVTLHSESDTNILTVSDDGCGFPPGADLTIADSFGLQLVTT